MEGAYCAAVRDIVGPETPVAIAPDMHANISQLLADRYTALRPCKETERGLIVLPLLLLLLHSIDICCVWRTNPHVDAYERAVKAAELLHRTMAGEIAPVMHLETPPLVVSIVKQFTGALLIKHHPPQDVRGCRYDVTLRYYCHNNSTTNILNIIVLLKI